MGAVVWYILGSVLGGFVVAVFFLSAWVNTSMFGDVKFDKREDKTIYRLEFDKDPIRMTERKYVVFRIKKDILESQEKQSL